MAFENGVNWKPLAPNERGRYATFGAAVDAVARALAVEHNAFFDSLVDVWTTLFPNSPARPVFRRRLRATACVRNSS